MIKSREVKTSYNSLHAPMSCLKSFYHKNSGTIQACKTENRKCVAYIMYIREMKDNSCSKFCDWKGLARICS